MSPSWLLLFSHHLVAFRTFSAVITAAAAAVAVTKIVRVEIHCTRCIRNFMFVRNSSTIQRRSLSFFELVHTLVSVLWLRTRSRLVLFALVRRKGSAACQQQQQQQSFRMKQRLVPLNDVPLCVLTREWFINIYPRKCKMRGVPRDFDSTVGAGRDDIKRKLVVAKQNVTSWTCTAN